MEGQKSPRWGYLVIWEFRPSPGAHARFEEAYGPTGLWASLFSKSQGYVATELNRDLKDPSRYVTLDLWMSKEAYDAFRAAYEVEYRRMDQKCEALTAEEKFIGSFERL